MAIAISECRNAKYVRSDNSLIDVEINHPEFGWIPYTINDDDTDTTINNASLKTLIENQYVRKGMRDTCLQHRNELHLNSTVKDFIKLFNDLLE